MSLGAVGLRHLRDTTESRTKKSAGRKVRSSPSSSRPLKHTKLQDTPPPLPPVQSAASTPVSSKATEHTSRDRSLAVQEGGRRHGRLRHRGSRDRSLSSVERPRSRSESEGHRYVRRGRRYRSPEVDRHRRHSRRRYTSRERWHRSSHRSSRYSYSSEEEAPYKSTSEISDEGWEVESNQTYRRRRSPTASSWPSASPFILIKNLSATCTEDLLEERIRAISIQKGFSLPNSVVLQRDTLAADASWVATVAFPSIEAASRFLNVCGKRGTLFVANRHCTVEFAPTTPSLESSAYGQTTHSSVSLRKDSDWTCAQCRYRNFARRSICGSCGAAVDATLPPPTEASVAPVLSSWILLKDIPLAITERGIRKEVDALLVETFLETTATGGSRNSSKAYEVVMVHPETASAKTGMNGRGFGFLKFATLVDVMPLVEALQSLTVFLNSKTIRVEAVSVREKEAFVEMVKMANVPNEDSFLLSDLERISTASGVSPYWKEYVLQWTSRSIYVPRGPPNVLDFVFEPNSGYLYDASLRLYYDPSTQYYMNSNGDYYVWEATTSSLRRIFSFDHSSTIEAEQRPQEVDVAHMGEGFEGTELHRAYGESMEQSKKEQSASVVANVLAAAEQTAKASKDTVKVWQEEGMLEGSLRWVDNGEKTNVPVMSQSQKAKALHTNPLVSGAAAKPMVLDVSAVFQADTASVSQEAPLEVASTKEGVGLRVFDEPSKSLSSHSTSSSLSHGGVVSSFDSTHGSALAPTVEASTSKGGRHTHTLIEEARFVCFVCIRRFTTATMLERHERFSVLHRANLGYGSQIQ